MDEYENQRQKPFENSLGIEIYPNPSDYIFIALDSGSYGEPLKYRRIMDTFTRYSKYFGKKVYAHMFRHTFATKLLRSGIRERYIQEALGHEYITTTQRYLHVSNNELSIMHKSVFGV